MKRYRQIGMLLPAIWLAALAFAEVPTLMNYQGRLLDPGGQPVNDTVDVSVGIYTNLAGGAAVYTEAVGPVVVANGIYTFQFGGDGAAAKAALLGGSCWLEVSIDGDALAPRQQLISTPFAIRSSEVDFVGSNTIFAAGVVPSAAVVETDPRWAAASNPVMVASAHAEETYDWLIPRADSIVTNEVDPVFAASAAALVSGADTQRWNETQGWGDHSLVGYVTTGYVDSATGTLHTTVSGEIDSDVASATGALHTTVSAEIDADVGAATGACVQISGDTMTGKLVLPANGLLVGSSQLIVTNGHVGIGTSNPTNALDVNGTIRAKEVFVTADGWPDYVFGKDYALRPLSELEAFIQANGHLPGVPSAGEVASRGVGVGEMQSKLLEKVEELTLHMLNLRRENDDLRRRVVRLEQHRRASPAR